MTTQHKTVRWARIGLIAAFGGALISQHPAITSAADHNDPIGVQANYQSGTVDGYSVDTNDPNADIADAFLWYTGEPGAVKTVVAALTWRVDPLEENEKSFDPSVGYGLHIGKGGGLADINLSDDDGLEVRSNVKRKADYNIVAWFGQKKTDDGGEPQWGVHVSGLPGSDAPLVGPVGTVLETSAGVKVATGLFDDAFFADLDGFFNATYVALREGAEDSPNPSLPPGRFTYLNPDTGAGGNLLKRPLGYPEKPLDGFGHQNVHAMVVEIPVALFKGETKIRAWSTTKRVLGRKKTGQRLECSTHRPAGATIDEYKCSRGGAQ